MRIAESTVKIFTMFRSLVEICCEAPLREEAVAIHHELDTPVERLSLLDQRVDLGPAPPPRPGTTLSRRRSRESCVRLAIDDAM